MAEKHAFATLLRSSKGDALVLLATFALVVFRDLTEGIIVGFVLGALLFIDRMAKSVAVEADAPLPQEDVADTTNGGRTSYDTDIATDPDIVVYKISGAFFFGAASTVGAVLDRIADKYRTFILDCSTVPHLDSTAANVLAGAARKAHRAGVRFVIAGASHQVRAALLAHGVRPPMAEFAADVAQAKERNTRTGDPVAQQV
jgi:SulP family sulfate permease